MAVAEAAEGLPRMRGDRPYARANFSSPKGFTPHARGSTPYALIAIKDCEVYPACAGIDPA